MHPKVIEPKDELVKVTQNERERVARARETGHVTFMGIDLVSLPGTLVPRVETELLARAAIDKLALLERASHVVDVCCGSGNIACAIAMRIPRARVWASDLTDEAVANARANVEDLALGDRVEVVQGDLLAALVGHELEGSIDLIACNPPYISTSRLDKERSDLLASEPREAFDGGPYGLTNHQRVIRDALAYLRIGGFLAVEVGVGQAHQVDLLFVRANGYAVAEHLEDDSGNVRVVIAERNQ